MVDLSRGKYDQNKGKYGQIRVKGLNKAKYDQIRENIIIRKPVLTKNTST